MKDSYEVVQVKADRTIPPCAGFFFGSESPFI